MKRSRKYNFKSTCEWLRVVTREPCEDTRVTLRIGTKVGKSLKLLKVGACATSLGNHQEALAATQVTAGLEGDHFRVVSCFVGLVCLTWEVD